MKSARVIKEKSIPFIKPFYPKPQALCKNFRAYFKEGTYNEQTNAILEFEERLSKFLGVKYCVSVCNGTLGLIIALRVLDLKGNVILPSFSFSATAHALTWNGIRPNFVDIDPKTFNLEPKKVKKAVNSRTTAILAAHMFGNPCQIEQLQDIAKQYNLKLIFDSAHALGSTYKNKLIGRFGDLEVFSFHATKLLPVGEGGAVVTNSKKLYEKLKYVRTQGNRGDGNCIIVGLNAKISPYGAMIGLEGLKNFKVKLSGRIKLAQYYFDLLKKIPGIHFQEITECAESNFQYIPIVINKKQFGCSRDRLFDILKRKHIYTRKYFHPPIHKFRCYKHIFNKENLKNTEDISNNILCLPFYDNIKKSTIETVCSNIKKLANRFTLSDEHI